MGQPNPWTTLIGHDRQNRLTVGAQSARALQTFPSESICSELQFARTPVQFSSVRVLRTNLNKAVFTADELN